MDVAKGLAIAMGMLAAAVTGAGAAAAQLPADIPSGNPLGPAAGQSTAQAEAAAGLMMQAQLRAAGLARARQQAAMNDAFARPSTPAGQQDEEDADPSRGARSAAAGGGASRASAYGPGYLQIRTPWDRR